MFRFGDPGGRMYTSVGTSNVNLLAWWTSVGSSSTWSVSATNGRTGGSSLRCVHSGYDFLQKTLDAQSTWGVALAFRTTTLPTAAAGIVVASFIDGTTTQVDFRVISTGQIVITRNGTVLGTSTNSILTNAYYFMEMKVLINSSTGTAELRVNGVAWIGPLTSQNTQATGNASANVVSLSTSTNVNTSAFTADYDDVVFWDGQTTDANGFSDIHDFIGDCGLVWLLPTGAGSTTQFTPLTGSNWSEVNEATPDGDTSYVEDSTVGQLDTYAMADLAGTAVTVKSLACVSYARKTDVGSRGMKTELRSASANASHATEISLGNSYIYNFQNWGQDPNNGSATNWTPTSVNAVEAGQTVSS